MSDNRMKANKLSPTAVVAAIKDPQRRKDAKTLLAMMKRVTRQKPVMWGSSIVGFGKYHYIYATGREGDACVTGFSSRKDSLTVYVLPGLYAQKANLKKLGKVKTGVSCIYIKALDDIHMPTLEKMVKRAFVDIRKVAAAMRKARQKKTKK